MTMAEDEKAIFTATKVRDLLRQAADGALHQVEAVGKSGRASFQAVSIAAGILIAAAELATVVVAGMQTISAMDEQEAEAERIAREAGKGGAE
jgi:hypothetical protein